MQEVDISNFITWWFNQVITIIQQAFSIIDNIKFLGTSLLDVIIAIIIIGIILRIFLSIAKGTGTTIRNGKERKVRNDN